MHHGLPEELVSAMRKGTGEILSSLRNRSGLSLEQVAESLARAQVERIKALEEGRESIHGAEALELAEVYGAEPFKVMMEIQDTVLSIRAKFQSENSPKP